MPTTTDLKTQLQSHYAELEKAFQSKDLATIGRFTADDFIAHAPNGETKTKEDLLRSLGQMFQSMDILSWPRQIEKLETEGNQVAIATAGGVFKTRKASGEVSELNLVNEDRWEEREGNWEITSSRPAPGSSW